MAKEYLKANCTLKIKHLCSALELARSSFYSAKKARIKQNKLDKQIFEQIKKAWEDFPGWGARKLASLLKSNHKRIQRILNKYKRERRSLALIKDKKGKEKNIRVFPNLIKKITRDLIKYPEKQKRGNWLLKDGKNKYRKIIEPTRPYQLWAGDWKELKLNLLGVTIYIFIIIDCYTRQLKGWHVSLIKDGRSAVKASKMAVESSREDPLFNPRKLIMHTDQGSAYLSEEYEIYWKSLGIKLSMADKGKPTQNPYIEAFISILKRFWLNYHEFLTVVELKESLTKFFKRYNKKWIHGEIGFITPNQRLERYRAYLKT